MFCLRPLPTHRLIMNNLEEVEGRRLRHLSPPHEVIRPWVKTLRESAAHSFHSTWEISRLTMLVAPRTQRVRSFQECRTVLQRIILDVAFTKLNSCIVVGANFVTGPRRASSSSSFKMLSATSSKNDIYLEEGCTSVASIRYCDCWRFPWFTFSFKLFVCQDKNESIIGLFWMRSVTYEPGPQKVLKTACELNQCPLSYH